MFLKSCVGCDYDVLHKSPSGLNVTVRISLNFSLKLLSEYVCEEKELPDKPNFLRPAVC